MEHIETGLITWLCYYYVDYNLLFSLLVHFLRSSVLKYANFNEDTTSRYYDYFALSGSMSATCFYA